MTINRRRRLQALNPAPAAPPEPEEIALHGTLEEQFGQLPVGTRILDSRLVPENTITMIAGDAYIHPDTRAAMLAQARQQLGPNPPPVPAIATEGVDQPRLQWSADGVTWNDVGDAADTGAFELIAMDSGRTRIEAVPMTQNRCWYKVDLHLTCRIPITHIGRLGDRLRRVLYRDGMGNLRTFFDFIEDKPGVPHLPVLRFGPHRVPGSDLGMTVAPGDTLTLDIRIDGVYGNPWIHAGMVPDFFIEYART